MFRQYNNQIEICVQNSFKENGNFNSTNHMLENDSEWAHKLGLNYHPNFTINNFTYRGDITYSDLMEAICASFNKWFAKCDTDELWKLFSGSL